jgi:HK97 family phage portal protein
MRLFGLNISLAKAMPQGAWPFTWSGSSSWWPVIREPYPGAWQRNESIQMQPVTAHAAVYRCITLRASDIGKCPPVLKEKVEGIWEEAESNAFSPVLRKPNRYQTRIQFYENWINSKDFHGNTYVLKQRDERRVVVALYILDPTRTKPMVAPDGAVWYQLSQDNLTGIEEANVYVPASEIIHDRTSLTHHPLCGIPPMHPAALAAVHGLSIQNNASKFFENGSRPGGVLTAPGTITDPVAERLKKYWEENFTGENQGRVAVLGDGLKYEQMTANAVDSQLIEQFGLTAKMVCTSFGVPAYMAGVEPPPPHNNIEALNRQYYTQCLQKDFEAIEVLLDEGLGLDKLAGKTYGVEFDLDVLLRMDTATLYKTLGEGVKNTILSPNEARARVGYKPVKGGNSPLSQQQNYSLEALAKRDAKEDPFASNAPKPPSAPDDGEDDAAEAADNDNEREVANFRAELWKGLANAV